jgi:phage host-nuclease inhibitor protein Gam
MESDRLKIEQDITDRIKTLAGSLNRTSNLISRRDEKIKRIKDEAIEEIIKEQNFTEEVGNSIYKIFKANRALLTDNGRNQTLELKLGKIGVRLNRPSVWVKNIQQNIEKLKNSGGRRFIRKKEECFLNKAAIANEASLFDNFEEISITQKEVFYVKPILADKEYRKDIKKIRLNKKAIKKKD